MHSDAEPGVLSGRVQMESHPHLSLKRKKDGRHQAHKAALTGRYGGSIKRDAVLLMKKVKAFLYSLEKM